MVELYSGLDGLPHYNPDHEDDPAPQVIEFRKRVGAADALIIASPEYARGVPGSLKNALDWLVGGSDEFVGKAVALFNTSPRATHAQESLKITLATMAGRVIEEASIAVSLLGKNLDEEAVLADAAIARTIRDALTSLRAARGPRVR